MKRRDITQFLIWELVIVLGLFGLIGGGIYVDAHYRAATESSETALAAPATPNPTALPTTTSRPSPTIVVSREPAATAISKASTGGLVVNPSAGVDSIEWVSANENEVEFGESYLYIVMRNGTVFHGPMDFELSFIPAGSTVFMTELSDNVKTEDSAFVLNVLPGHTGNPTGKFVFKAGQQAIVEEALGTSHLLSFRLNNLFPEGQLDLVGQDRSVAPQLTQAQLPIKPADAVNAEDVPATATPTYVVITSTPTPENLQTAVALASTATYEATATGTPTALPPNWVTPWIVTSTPSPQNQATAQFLHAEAAAAAELYGTPLPPANNMVIATLQPTETPTPIFILLDGELPPMTPTPTPEATLAPTPPIPTQLIGKIAFKSDRSGQEEIYVINPDGSQLALLTDPWPYNMARLADSFSADGRFRVFTKDAVRYKNTHDPITNEVTGAKRVDAPALFWYDSLYRVEEQLTHFGAGIAYAGAWSPTEEQIVFVSSDSGNDEIWVVYRDGSKLTQLTRDESNWWDKHPSWSPDGRQIVFWSNRTGHKQIWVMAADGSDLYSLSRTGYNDWDPVWIKYPGIPANALELHMPYSGPYTASGSDRSCRDFENRAEAQAFYLVAGGPYRDPHKLDRDKDGIACN